MGTNLGVVGRAREKGGAESCAKAKLGEQESALGRLSLLGAWGASSKQQMQLSRPGRRQQARDAVEAHVAADDDGLSPTVLPRGSDLERADGCGQHHHQQQQHQLRENRRAAGVPLSLAEKREGAHVNRIGV
ncbi:hypothetical protein AXG93_108s1030 [Marchantia polymorpha subsp. ruderalis]|uniref:Uncharacterized protein n=1 Tax=Marchantia polymorpha subsp. ruderalis TaxID=1480154 RepID=A0A176VY10_MARPO|nr:hypothetical protein AXG93_108s1030 [Marchantia polymorpha subsp. ruderalis]